MRLLSTCAFATALLSLVPTGARAEVYTTVAITPEALLQRASSARGKLLSPAYREIDSTINGTRTISNNRLVDGNDYLETSTDGPVVRSFGSFHGQDWEANPNGVVVRMSGYAALNDPFRQALNAPSSAESGARILGETSEASPSIVLELRPRDVLAQRRYYDARTYLLRRVETQTYDGHLRIREYEDYEAFNGRLIPRVSRYHDESPQNNSTTRVLTIEKLAKVDSALLAIPVSKRPFSFPSDASVDIPATFNANGIIVRLNCDGRGLDFILDSGASGIVVDRETARSLGLSLYGNNVITIGGDFSIATARLSNVSLGALHVASIAVDVVPFTLSLGDTKVVGLLGGDFFSSGAVTIDFKDQRVSIAPHLDAPPSGFSKISIDTDRYVPMFPAAFNGKNGHFVADLGATSTVLFPHYFSKFKAPAESEDPGGFRFVGGTTGVRRYELSSFVIGDYNVQNVLVAVPSNRKVEDVDYDGLVGRDLLDSFTVIFDYPHGSMYVKPYGAAPDSLPSP
ncbi:MAG: pepsin/retropepsin-like aspartic protease family protein [Candidatus Eremiobacteraeota bacterium]|nr:pepsin/retropepsin-like aspartic protease family protein [Candidatus Eremiobacteraeota bacterium]